MQDTISLAVEGERDNPGAFDDGESIGGSNGSSERRGESNTSPERNGNSNGTADQRPCKPVTPVISGKKSKTTAVTTAKNHHLHPLEIRLWTLSFAFLLVHSQGTQMNLGPSLSQDLSISFDLQIDPSPQRGKTNFAILIDNLVPRASDDDAVATIPQTARYTTNRLAITVGPSGRCHPQKAVSTLF
jgi:hypothetical protein